MPQEKIYEIEERSKKDVEGILHPLVKEWFFSKFDDLSHTQRYGVMPIWERKNILVSAPTGGTKTLTAFLSILNYLVMLAEKNELDDKIYAVYVSPLKALTNDIHKNLIEPLDEIYALADRRGAKLQQIRVGLRTGDTTVSERAKMARKTPHIFVTTPESLAIVLTSKKFVDKLNAVEFCIVDEIHALDNKRGAYLSLTLERLNEVSTIFPVKIGLSATIAPLEEVAKYLVGFGMDEDDVVSLRDSESHHHSPPNSAMRFSSQDTLTKSHNLAHPSRERNKQNRAGRSGDGELDIRRVGIAPVILNKKIDVQVLSPVDDLIRDKTAYPAMFELLDKMISEHKTTLVFTNTRSATERVVNHLKEKFPTEYGDHNIAAHHSSLSKDFRFDIEERLRNGELKAVVCSTSLELGIDIGYIDLVLMLGSPKSSARALQRLGRAGHQLHNTAKGRFIINDRDDLIESCVIQKEMIERKINRVRFPKNALDVLAQQIYGMAIYKVWKKDELLETIKKSYCYHELSKNDFLDVISYLAGEYALEKSFVYAKIWYDPVSEEIGKKGMMARVMYLTNIGTIPDESFVTVKLAPAGEPIGHIDEGFMERMKKGDVFVLGGKKYMYAYTRGMNLYVRGDVKRPPTIPSWFSEMLPLSFDSGLEINRFRGLMRELFEKKKSKKEIESFIKEHLYVEGKTATAIYNYFREQHKFLEIPHPGIMLIERYKSGKNYLIFHSMYGRRVNDALSRAIAFLIGRAGGRDVEVGINDNGFYLAGEKLPIDKIWKLLKPGKLHEILEEAINKSDVLARRFRHCASRSLMILKNYKGRSKTVGKQQMKSHFLLHAVKKLTNKFPILREARREVLEDLMDIDNTKMILEWLEKNRIKVKIKDTNLPSPFALNLMLQGQTDLLRMEDRQEFLERMHEEHLRAIGEIKG